MEKLTRRGFVKAAGAALIDVLEHDDARLHRYAEEREETDARRHTEMRAGDEKRQ